MRSHSVIRLTVARNLHVIVTLNRF